MIRHVIFDCFGTLLDTGTGSLEAVREILRNIRCDADPQEFYTAWKNRKKELMWKEPFRTEKEWFVVSLQSILAGYGIDADASSAAEPMIRSLFGFRPLYPDVLPAIRMLSEMRIDYAIGSTTDNDSIRYYLDQNRLETELVFTSEDLRCYKPDPRFYLGILERTGWKAGECLFVGDSPAEDVLGPKRAGMKAVFLNRKENSWPEDAGTVPDAEIRSLAELGKVLAQTL